MNEVARQHGTGATQACRAMYEHGCLLLQVNACELDKAIALIKRLRPHVANRQM